MPMKNFIEVRVLVSGKDDSSDIIIARLSELGFDSFVEEEGSVLAYRESDKLNEKEQKAILESHGIDVKKVSIIADKNWNAAWESAYEAVVIGNEVMVRAPFHQALEGIVYDIIIEPRMAFGTAHHETTSQILSLITGMDIGGKKVLDMGCGTAVLAILAHKMGASEILAIDNDEWAYQNSLDNISLNDADEIKVLLGDADLLKNKEFDIIFANINRNILLQDIPRYAGVLTKNGSLVMSGFYADDLPLIEEKALASGLRLESTSIKNKWMAAIFICE